MSLIQQPYLTDINLMELFNFPMGPTSGFQDPQEESLLIKEKTHNKYMEN